jgi:hypothetical protein
MRFTPMAESARGAHEMTELPLAYGVFCAAFDWCGSRLFLYSPARVECSLEGACLLMMIQC